MMVLLNKKVRAWIGRQLTKVFLFTGLLMILHTGLQSYQFDTAMSTVIESFKQLSHSPIVDPE